MPNPIGLLNERHLHAALKRWYAQPGDLTEVAVDGFKIDLVRGDLLIEIQTRNLSALKRKLATLVERHPVRLIYPVAQDKWIVRQSPSGRRVLGRRKSPQHGGVELVFEELVSLPRLLTHPNFSLEVVLIQEEEIRRHDGARNWRRKGWGTHERRLIRVVGQRLFETPAEQGELIPADLAEPFTTAQLAESLGRPLWLAQKMAYCLRQIGVITAAGKRGRGLLYVRAAA
jgi:hypothetical protein